MIVLILRLRWCFHRTFMSSHFCLSTRFPPPPYTEVLLLYFHFLLTALMQQEPPQFGKGGLLMRQGLCKQNQIEVQRMSTVGRGATDQWGKMYPEAKGTHGFPGI